MLYMSEFLLKFKDLKAKEIRAGDAQCFKSLELYSKL